MEDSEFLTMENSSKTNLDDEMELQPLQLTLQRSLNQGFSKLPIDAYTYIEPKMENHDLILDQLQLKQQLSMNQDENMGYQYNRQDIEFSPESETYQTEIHVQNLDNRDIKQEEIQHFQNFNQQQQIEQYQQQLQNQQHFTKIEHIPSFEQEVYINRVDNKDTKFQLTKKIKKQKNGPFNSSTISNAPMSANSEISNSGKKKRNMVKKDHVKPRDKSSTVKQIFYWLTYWHYYQSEEFIQYINGQQQNQQRPFSQTFSIEIIGFQMYQKQLEYESELISNIQNKNVDRKKQNKVYAEQASRVLQVEKKTLDDYQTIFRKGFFLNYNFDQDIQENSNISRLRAFVNEHEKRQGKKISTSQLDQFKMQDAKKRIREYIQNKDMY